MASKSASTSTGGFLGGPNHGPAQAGNPQTTPKINPNSPFNITQPQRKGKDNFQQQKAQESPENSSESKSQQNANPSNLIDQNTFQLPSIIKPTGGGALRSLNETIEVSAATGALALSIPIPVTQISRFGAPTLSLQYSSGGGNGIFGLGWQLAGLSSITRVTRPILPTYTDDDLFALDGQQIVPLDFPIVEHDGWFVRRFGERVTGSHHKIEKWTRLSESFWRVMTTNNGTLIYGVDESSRVSDGDKVFEWHLRESYDHHGGAQLIEYKVEDGKNVDLTLACEQNREAEERCRQRYISSIKYGNISPNRDFKWNVIKPRAYASEWLFEVVFSYGQSGSQVDWAVRQDPFSIYNAGYEIRTYRLCTSISMVHHFTKENGKSCVISETEFLYDESPSLSLLKGVHFKGFDLEGTSQSLPPVEFGYTQKPSRTKLKETALSPLNSEQLDSIAGMVATEHYWVSLLGDGLPGVLALTNSEWLYSRLTVKNSTPRLDQGRFLTEKPNLKSNSRQFGIITKSTAQEYLVDQHGLTGFYRRVAQDQDEWDTFKTIRSLPNIDLNTEEGHFVDLTGDGVPDFMITQGGRLRWYRSLEAEGYEGPIQTLFDRHKAPQCVHTDPKVSIIIADMNGDGLGDIVRIESRKVAYWPNLGYGNFGAMVVMDNAPHLDAHETYSPKRVVIGDIDGSGTSDLIYIGHGGRARIYFNESGNSWSKGTTLTSLLPYFDERCSVSIVDILGNGTSSLVWNNFGATIGPSNRCLLYADLMNGTKPYLLNSCINNMGSEDAFEYKPSTYYYMLDEDERQPWISKLPFPTQCISKTNHRDMVSKKSLQTRYRYHHGYFDEDERTFRGFGMVEQWDTEEYVSLENIPPIHTKTWYEIGVYKEAFKYQSNIQKEFSTAAEWTSNTFVNEELLKTEDIRDAHKALTGVIIRREIFSDDHTDLSTLPYRVEENHYAVRVAEPASVGRYQRFQVYSDQTLVKTYDRDMEGPIISRSLTIQDIWGNVTNQAIINEGKNVSTLPEPYKKEQEKTYITYSHSEFGKGLDAIDVFASPKLYRSSQYEVFGMRAGDFPFSESQAIPYYTDFRKSPSSLKGLRLSTRSEIQYRSNDLTRLLDLGKIESLLLPGETYTLAHTPETLAQYKLNGKVLFDFEKELTKACFVKRGEQWWVPSGRVYFGIENAPSIELSNGKLAFFLPTLSIDAFKSTSTMEFDRYHLFTVKSIDPVGNVSQATIDYRAFQPNSTKDPNDNEIQYSFDCLGAVVGMAVVGKGSLDSLDGFSPILDETTLDRWQNSPKAEASKLLANATTRYLYNYESYMKNGPSKPNWSSSIQATRFSGDVSRDNIVEFSYTSGSGEIMQSLQQAEDNQWRVSGWLITNNKNLPVQKFEPFFSRDNQFKFEQKEGASLTLFYDSLARPIMTVFPDGTWTSTEYQKWSTISTQKNQNVLKSPNYPGGQLSKTEFINWSDIMDKKGGYKAKAVLKSTQVQAESKTVHYNSLGSGFFTERTWNKDTISSKLLFDYEGRLLQELNVHDQAVVKNVYNFTGSSIHLTSLNTGSQFALYDVSGSCVLWFDDLGNMVRTEYDALGRVIQMFLNGEETKKFVYGEAEADAKSRNLRGMASKVYNQVGCISYLRYDVFGNPLETSRQVTKQYKGIVNWADNPELGQENFLQTFTYDALSRNLTTSYGKEYTISHTYSETGIQKVSEGGSVYISSVDYDASQQPSKIAYGNGATAYTELDPLTWKVTRKRLVSKGKTLQDFEYIYDAQGNVVFCISKTEKEIYRNNVRVDPVSEYTYDGFNRLLRATGRELLGQTGGKAPSQSDSGFAEAPRDLRRLAAYTETYKYDLLGNLEKLEHQIYDAEHSGWTRTLKYDEKNQLLSSRVGSESEEYAYDQHGNMTRCGGSRYTNWDHLNSLRSATVERTKDGTGSDTVWYTYDDGLNRERKVVERSSDGSKWTEHLYLDGLDVYRKYDSSGTVVLECRTLRVSGGGKDLLLIESWSGIQREEKRLPEKMRRYQHQEGSGSITIELDDDAKLISQEEYSPYGSTTYGIGVQDKRFRFAGKERDKETGLSYFGLRYYIPWLCRWLNPDPLGNADGPNLYLFVQSNPISYTDPTGGNVLEDLDFSYTNISAAVSTREHQEDDFEDHEILAMRYMLVIEADKLTVTDPGTGENIRLNYTHDKTEHDGPYGQKHGLPANVRHKMQKDQSHLMKKALGEKYLGPLGINVNWITLRIYHDDHALLFTASGKVDKSWETFFKGYIKTPEYKAAAAAIKSGATSAAEKREWQTHVIADVWVEMKKILSKHRILPFDEAHTVAQFVTHHAFSDNAMLFTHGKYPIESWALHTDRLEGQVKTLTQEKEELEEENEELVTQRENFKRKYEEKKEKVKEKDEEIDDLKDKLAALQKKFDRLKRQKN